jgi:hypothetical protein
VTITTTVTVTTATTTVAVVVVVAAVEAATQLPFRVGHTVQDVIAEVRGAVEDVAEEAGERRPALVPAFGHVSYLPLLRSVVGRTGVFSPVPAIAVSSRWRNTETRVPLTGTVGPNKSATDCVWEKERNLFLESLGSRATRREWWIGVGAVSAVGCRGGR